MQNSTLMIEEEIKWVAIPFATDSLEASRLVDNYLYHIKSCYELEYIQHKMVFVFKAQRVCSKITITSIPFHMDIRLKSPRNR